MFWRRVIKFLVESLHLNKRKGVKLWKKENNIVNHHLKNNYEEQIMLSRSILLEKSFKEVGIANHAFPYLTIDDSLASAFIIFESEGVNRIVVIDQGGLPVGILDRESILREFPPPEKSIPYRSNTTVQDTYINQRVCDAIRSTSKEKLFDVRHLIRKVKSFREDDFLLYGISYFLSNSHYMADDILILTNHSMCVTSIVSGKAILKYLLKYIDVNTFSIDIKSILPDIPFSGSTVICSSDELMEDALYEIDHTPAISLLVEKNGRLVGILTREVINQLIHPLYPELFTYSLDRFMERISESRVFKPESSLMNLCQHLIEHHYEFVVVGNTTKHQKRKYKSGDSIEYRIISVFSMLDLIVSKITITT